MSSKITLFGYMQPAMTTTPRSSTVVNGGRWPNIFQYERIAVAVSPDGALDLREKGEVMIWRRNGQYPEAAWAPSKKAGARVLGKAVLMAAALLTIAACGGATPTSPQGAQESVPQASTPRPAQAPTLQATAVPGAAVLQTALAVSDLSVGPNRMAFGLIDSQSGPLRNAAVQVSTFYLGGSAAEGPLATVEALFRQWPAGPGGVYTAQLSFDRPGPWGLGVVVTGTDGSSRESSVRLDVKEKSATPAIGSPAPRSISKTTRQVGKLEELTTAPRPDPEMYAMTIAEAVKAGKPLVVVFATPAYCTSKTCGPQVDVIKELKQRYVSRVNFIHVEIYDNLLEIQGDLSRARVSPTVTEWNLPSEPWTFIVDSGGNVHSKFEGFATSEELEGAVAAVLK